MNEQVIGNQQAAQRNAKYNEQALAYLKNQFRTISVNVIKATWTNQYSNLFLSYDALSILSRHDRSKGQPDYLGVETSFLGSQRKTDKLHLSHPGLIKAINAIAELNGNEERPSSYHSLVDKEDVNLEGCPICCDKFSKADMLPCTYNEHWFCRECLENYITLEVFEKSVTQLTCKFTSSVADHCNGTFTPKVIDLAIPNKCTRAKVDELIAKANLRQAVRDDNMWYAYKLQQHHHHHILHC